MKRLCLLSLVLTSILTAAVLPQSVSLPVPSGKYPVGTSVYYLNDEAREEPWTKDPDDRRRIPVQLWYPAADGKKGSRAPYIVGLGEIRSSIKKYWNDMPTVSTSSILNAELRQSKEPFPVVVFSHGMNSGRFAYSSYFQELASRGFVVAAIDHSYWGPGVAFPDGRHIRFEDGMIARNTLSSDEIDKMMMEGIEVMAGDQAFVASWIGNLNKADKRFAGHLDLSKIAVVGHSMGGMAATVSCLRYSIFKSCVSLDGANYFLNKMPNTSAKSFLLLLNSQWGKNVPRNISVRYLEAWANPLVYVVDGTKHSSFSDIPLIENSKASESLIDPRLANRIVSEFLAEFLMKSLNDQKKQEPRFEQFQKVDLKNVKPDPTSK